MRGLALTILLLGSLSAALAQEVTPTDYIAARRALMTAIDTEMYYLGIPAESDEDVLRLRDHAMAIAAMMRAFPLLFPPEKPQAVPEPEPTFAAPNLWTDYARFLTLSREVSDTAEAAALAEDPAELAAGIAKLHDSCGTCHSEFVAAEPRF